MRGVAIFRVLRFGVLIGAGVAAAALVARADSVTTTRGWTNCVGGDGTWPEMRIAGCNEVIKSGKASGADLARAYYYRANAQLSKEQYATAIADYDRALEIERENADALSERCWARAIIGMELDAALSDCNEALRFSPNDAESLSARGFAYLRLGLYRTAILDYDAALKMDGDNALYLVARGTAKVRAGDAEDGASDIAAAQARDAKAEAKFARYEQANQTGFWASVADYWRAAMKWVY